MRTTDLGTKRGSSGRRQHDRQSRSYPCSSSGWPTLPGFHGAGERKDISNGIWLCSNHADLVDDDDITYTADELRGMKLEHEANCERRHREGIRKGTPVQELIAIGPDIVFCGELTGADQSAWSFHLQDFVDGDLHALLGFIARYDRTPPMDRYSW
jgi:hypothetical protein